MARRDRRRRLRTRRVDTVPSSRPVQIHVTLTPGQLVWLLTGIGIGELRLLYEIVRGLVSG